MRRAPSACFPGAHNWPSEIDPAAQRRFAVEVVEQLRAAGYVAYWAGGCVRDALAGPRSPRTTTWPPAPGPSEIRALFGQRRTLAIGAAFGVITVLGKKTGRPDRSGHLPPGHHLQRRPASRRGHLQHSRSRTPSAATSRSTACSTIRWPSRCSISSAAKADLAAKADPRHRPAARAVRRGQAAAAARRAVCRPLWFFDRAGHAQSDRGNGRPDRRGQHRTDRHGAAADFAPSAASGGGNRIARRGRLAAGHRCRSWPRRKTLAERRRRRDDWPITLAVLGGLDEPSFPLALAALGPSPASAERSCQAGPEAQTSHRRDPSAPPGSWLSTKSCSSPRRCPGPSLQRLLVADECGRIVGAWPKRSWQATRADPSGVEHCREQAAICPPTNSIRRRLLTGDDLVGHGIPPARSINSCSKACATRSWKRRSPPRPKPWRWSTSFANRPSSNKRGAGASGVLWITGRHLDRVAGQNLRHVRSLRKPNCGPAIGK